MELACDGMSRRDANDLVKRILPRYEAGLKTASVGKSYAECFSVATGEPRPEYEDFVAAGCVN